MRFPDPATLPAPRFGVYVHFPFCARRCGYCDFATVACSQIPHRAYAEAVLAELAVRAEAFAGQPLTSIYFGGGTPSLWDPAEVARVVAAVRRAFPSRLDGGVDPEITLEMNPADVEADRIEALAAGGVNRISLGVQSFDAAALRLLGRRHDPDGARRALARLRQSDIPRLTFDLIGGLPGQTPAAWQADLDEALRWEAGHLSVYTLSLEPQVPLGRALAAGRIRLPDEEESLVLLRQTRRTLGEAGLPRYEISNHARPGQESRHNLLYWRGLPWLGLGAGAHSHRPLGPGQAERWANVDTAAAYLRAAPGSTAFHERLGPVETAQERLLCALRLDEGLELEPHRQAGGADLARDATGQVATLEQAGLLLRQAGRLRLTERGFEVADAVIEALAR